MMRTDKAFRASDVSLMTEEDLPTIKVSLEPRLRSHEIRALFGEPGTGVTVIFNAVSAGKPTLLITACDSTGFIFLGSGFSSTRNPALIAENAAKTVTEKIIFVIFIITYTAIIKIQSSFNIFGIRSRKLQLTEIVS